jgi:uncharacterized protein (DUF1499 family)
MIDEGHCDIPKNSNEYSVQSKNGHPMRSTRASFRLAGIERIPRVVDTVVVLPAAHAIHFDANHHYLTGTSVVHSSVDDVTTFAIQIRASMIHDRNKTKIG